MRLFCIVECYSLEVNYVVDDICVCDVESCSIDYFVFVSVNEFVLIDDV